MLAQSPPKLLRSWGAVDLMDLEARGLLGNRLGRLEVQEKSLARVGREASRAIDFKIQLAQDSLRLYVDAKTGGLSWQATISRPDTCARLARIALRLNSRHGSDVSRINPLAETLRAWQQTAPHPLPGARRDVDGRMRARGEKAHRGMTSIAGWRGRCRLGNVVGLMSPAFFTGNPNSRGHW